MPSRPTSALAAAPRAIPRHLYQVRAAVGLDLHDAPPDIADGYYTQLDNIVIVGRRPRVRPGKVGLLSAPFPAPLYLLREYVVGGVPKILGTSGGKLYSFAPPAVPGVGAATVTEIKYANGSSAAINSAAARADNLMVQGTPLLFLVDGGATPPYQIDPATNLVSAATGLNYPTTPPVAALTSTVIDSFTVASQWVADSLTGATVPPTNQVVNGQFTGGSGGGGANAATSEPGWTNFGRQSTGTTTRDRVPTASPAGTAGRGFWGTRPATAYRRRRR